MQMDADIGEHIICEAESLYAEGCLGLEQQHSLGCEPIGGKFEEAAVCVEAVWATVEGKGGFVAKDGELVQCFGGNVWWVGADQVEVAVGG